MATTGTRDFGAANETPPWRLKAYDLSPPGKQIRGGGRRLPPFGLRPGVWATREMGARGAALRRAQVDFWNTVLKRDAAGFRDLDALAAGSKQGDPGLDPAPLA